MTKLHVLYNGGCPICSREVAAYRRIADRCGADIVFEDLSGTDLSTWGLTATEAARSFHVRQNGQMLEGYDAFRHLWAALPGFRILAGIAGLPGLRALGRFIYDHGLAPALFRLHQRRQARRAGCAADPREISRCSASSTNSTPPSSP